MACHQYPSPGSSLPTLSSLPKYSQYSLSPKTCQFQTSKPRKTNPNHKPVTCQGRRNDEQSPLRRDVLIGLGGLYTAASNDPFTLAAPIIGPDLDHCQCNIEVFHEPLDERCCLLKPEGPIVDFTFDNYKRNCVERPAAHLVENDEKYYEKYCKKYEKDYYTMFEEAIEKMKSLPDSDPRSFRNQAKIHCAYCNSAYQLPLTKEDGAEQKFGSFQVHDSALFFPFHRWYLYFFERICGHLIGNPDFRLPFWNWDAPDGMQMPKRYTEDKNSPLYDVFRNSEHLPTGNSPTVNLQVKKPEEGVDQSLLNITIMHKAMVRNCKSPRDFFGRIYRAGENPPGPGSGGQIENGPHTAIHVWTGTPGKLHPDMGSFHTAGRDPLFYAHHANVDRMWNIWKSGEIPCNGTRVDYTDNTNPSKENDENDPCTKEDCVKDWSDTTFLFYDENQKMVRVKVGDSVDSKRLGYDYARVDIPWLNCPITPKEQPAQPNVSQTNKTMISSPFLSFFRTEPYQTSPTNSSTIKSPVKLNEVVEFTVHRPRKGKRTAKQKAKEDEVLVVRDIYSGEEDYVTFDVFINDDDYTTTTPLNSQFAGSFGTMEPSMRGGKGPNRRGADLSLALTEILEELNAEEAESIKVTLVPRIGCRDVTFGGIEIAYNAIS